MKFGRRKNEDRTGEVRTGEDPVNEDAVNEDAANDGSTDTGAGDGGAAAVAETAAGGDRPSPRAGGPWDSSEIDVPEDDSSYVDLGGLIVKGRTGFELQIPTEPDSGAPRAVMFVAEDSVVEVLVFAASRSAGLWDDVRAEITQEAERLHGEVEEIDGSFGTELQVQVPVQTEDGSPGTRPSRIIGVDGPRWLLRATFMGREAVQPVAGSVLESALRDVVVVRGKDAMAPREQIKVVLPENAVPVESKEQET